jgi:hypothetical protein
MSNYDVQILVNGSRCKQYNHNGKLFIEAKQGSEYTIEVKNHYWSRILTVCSVDGLDILNGETATDDSPGYVINARDTGKFDGFRVSDDKVAKFVFDYKNASYAASKQTGAEKNVGVIGVRIFNELVKPYPNYCDSTGGLYGQGRYGYDLEPRIYCDGTVTTTTTTTVRPADLGQAIADAKAVRATCCANTKGADEDYNLRFNLANMVEDNYIPVREPEYTSDRNSFLDRSNLVRSTAFNSYTQDPKPRGFDMGTKWGDAKLSKVIEVEFEKGILSQFTEIYYASRQSLIEMGVPLGNEKQVNFPTSFADSKYAKPPKNWRG